MSFFKKPEILKTEEYKIIPPKADSWRKRFEYVENWANSNPWDNDAQPSEKELKLCISELFEAINMNIEAFRFIEKKCTEIGADSPREIVLDTAKTVANILEGC